MINEQSVTDRDSDHVIIRGVRIELNDLVASSALRGVDALRDEFGRNVPFPHIVIDGLFAPALLELIHDEFERVTWREWDRYDSEDEVKRGSSKRARFGPATQMYFNTIHSRSFVQFVEGLTTFSGLVPDPELFGGGMHEIPDGGRFSVHVDFNRHPVTGLDNRLVLITYLNKDWQHSYGGALELWSTAENAKVVDVTPLFGRTIIFAQTPDTLHGHPVPVRAPGRRTRRSVAAYYYSNGDAGAGAGKDAWRTTRFIERQKRPLTDAAVRYVKYFTPPVVIDVARRVRGAVAPRR